ncbi:NFACT family protein [Bulleidia sp. zg-1006]|uniref:Rqc2 family fibronectin-binding protein n=1 Tax=Bulleidia sp. zg-1006 TaxID=2806552 RepID=UPI00193A7A42|nr:NFACT family protein [Bulleidia sp. zg-1006]QRG87277.1 NFACT family protein [Bulleidia sp. zg-1006]
MAVDGILLHKMIPLLQADLPLRIQKIWNLSNTELLFQVHGKNAKKQLLISTHSLYNRIQFTNRKFSTPEEPISFVMLLRKYIEGSTIESIEQVGLDRWLIMNIRANNHLGDIVHYQFVIELMGKYANCILVSPEGKILDALKRIPPFANQVRTIQPGALFIPCEAQKKKNPFQDFQFDADKNLTTQFAGFSPLLSKEIEYRLDHGQHFSAIMQEIEMSNSLYFSNDHNPNHFHTIALNHLGTNKELSLEEGLDYLYKDLEEQDRIKQLVGDVMKFIQKERKHQERKLPRLQEEYQEALDCNRYRIYGDLLYAHQEEVEKGLNSISLRSYENNEIITIPLDPELDCKSNARKMFRLYNKRKKSQSYLQEQIQKTILERDYFLSLEEQLSYANVESARQIQEQLIKQGYLKRKNRKNQKKKKDRKLAIHSLVSKTGLGIRFGKNSFQNEEVTWHSPKSFTWLHAQDYHGAHVVIESESPDEETLRLAANIAAYFSSGRYSSSVPVSYCLIKELKKIPGAKPGMVQLGSYKTIYIDPNEEELNAYKLLN